MLYLIDGYNLLFRLLDKGDEIQKSREKMIRDIGRKATLAALRCLLIFDSKYQPGEQTSHKEGDLLVVYTNEGETADEWIYQAVKKSQEKGITRVVTSDKKLARQIRLKGVQTLPCEEFMSYLNKRFKATLRALKQEKDKFPTLLPETSPPSKKKPLKGSTLYYEEIFEKNLLKTTPKPKKEVKRPSAITKTKREKITSESENERWARLFGA